MLRKFIKIATKQADKAFKKNFIPVGCVIILNNKVISKACNEEFWHAELNCIKKAQKKLGNFLNNCIMISTLEPCPMCLYAIKISRIKTLIILCKQRKVINHKLETVLWLNSDSENILNSFFKNKR